MKNKDRGKSIIAVISLSFVALAWGTSYAIIKDLVSQSSPFMLMSIRFGLSALLLSLVYLKKLLKISKDDFIRGSKIGIFMFGAFITLVLGIQYTTASKQSFIVGAYVLIVPFLSWLINQKKPNSYDIIGAIFAVVGLGLITLGGITGITIGDIVSLGCAFSFAFHMIMIEKYCHDSDPIILTVVQFILTSILFILLTLVFEQPNVNIIINSAPEIFYLVIVATVIAFVVQNVAQKYISSTNTALILTLESVFGSIFAVYYLGESLSLTMITGCFIVVIGIITQETKWEFIKNNLHKNK